MNTEPDGAVPVAVPVVEEENVGCCATAVPPEMYKSLAAVSFTDAVAATKVASLAGTSTGTPDPLLSRVRNNPSRQVPVLVATYKHSSAPVLVVVGFPVVVSMHAEYATPVGFKKPCPTRVARAAPTSKSHMLPLPASARYKTENTV
jgi:hypothetical protein